MERRKETDGGEQPRSLLRVDLETGDVETETVSKRHRDRFLAGKGIGAAVLYEDLDPGVDPLSPANELLFLLGPLTGYAPGTSRYAAVTKSPLTGGFVDSYSGGRFPSLLRFALPTVLGIVFEGRADDPVSFHVEDGETWLEDATHLWGRDTEETAREFTGRHTEAAAIGPAGENLVRFASIASDEATHHAGRGGVGAVMGSKRLKAVVATASSPLSGPALGDLRADHTRRLGTSEETGWARNGGTQNTVDWTQAVGALPSHNWTRGTLEDVESLNIDGFAPGHVGTDSCYACPIACGHVVDFADSGVDGAFPDAHVGWGPEYESIGMLGANTDITDVTAVTELTRLADTLGMDTISLGNALSFTMECAETGVVDYDLGWGDVAAAVRLVEAIAHREGFGDVLAEGTARAAETLDDDRAREAALHVKGMELPAYDPRASFSMALAYATSDRGACHMRSWPIGTDALGGEREPYDTADHAAYVVADQDETVLKYSAGVCAFTAYSYERVLEWLDALGYDYSVEDLALVGERSWNLVRLFNLREGFTRDDDSLPDRLTRPLERGGPADGNRLTREGFDEMLDDYYDRRGWTKDGRPTPETLARLDLTEFAVT